MGMFSWVTADTNEDILNVHTGDHETVYLLQPIGESIEETAYNGYGEFGGVDAYDWLADNNISKDILAKAEKLNIEKRDLGIYIDYKYYVDTRTDKKYCYVFDNLFDNLNGFENYGADVDGVEVNQLIKDGVWIEKPMSDYFGVVTLPLKFSFEADTSYNEVGASEISETQGFFVGEEVEEEWY